MIRVIRAIIVSIVAIIFTCCCIAANSQHQELLFMNKPGFITIKNKVNEIAHIKKLPDVAIHWTVNADGNYVANISRQGINKEIIFTKEEATRITQKGFSEKSINKINAALDFFTNTREPSPRKPR